MVTIITVDAVDAAVYATIFRKGSIYIIIPLTDDDDDEDDSTCS